MPTDQRNTFAAGYAARRTALTAGTAHVWRIPLGDATQEPELRFVLSADERARADRFHHAKDRIGYTLAHGWLRRILAEYMDGRPNAIEFETAQFGKPHLSGPSDETRVAFNLSHSGELALVAVTAGAAVGVDVEQWDRSIDHLALAEQCLSPRERAQLHSLTADGAARIEGFYAAWTRKEAYLKARGDGVTRGLTHFDVSLVPAEPARLLADRSDVGGGVRRWALAAINAAAGYSAAVACEGPLQHVRLRDV